MTTIIKNELISHIRQQAQEMTDNTNQPVVIIDEKNAIKLSERFDVTLREIYIYAMTLDIWPLRYIRNRNSFSLNDQLILAKSEVAVVGTGGLGGYVTLLLARLGIGKLVIIDNDIFDETNLNRQALSTTENIVEPKPEEAYSQIKLINPAVEVDSHCLRFKPEEAITLCKESNVIVDALDNAKDRLLLGNLSCKLGIPLVHGAVTGFEGRVMTVLPGDKGLDLLYNSEDDNPGFSSEQTQGTPAVAPCFIGSLQVMEVVKILLNRGRLYSKKIIHADLENGEFYTLEL